MFVDPGGLELPGFGGAVLEVAAATAASFEDSATADCDAESALVVVISGGWTEADCPNELSTAVPSGFAVVVILFDCVEAEAGISTSLDPTDCDIDTAVSESSMEAAVMVVDAVGSLVSVGVNPADGLGVVPGICD